MKKLVFSILLSCIAAVSMAQIFQTNNIPYKFRGVKGDSLVIIPTGVDTPYTTNPKWGENSTGALFLRTSDSSLWGKIGNRYSRITGAGGGSIATSGSTLYSTNPATSGFGTNSNILFGFEAGKNAPSLQESIFMGYQAGSVATSANASNFFGTYAGQNAVNSTGSNFFGSSAGKNATNASTSNFFGSSAGTSAVSASNSNFMGNQAGTNAANANGSNFYGASAGYNATNASYSNLLGYQTGYAATTAASIGANNIIIGTNISLPRATTNSMNLGGVLFGVNTYATTTGNPDTTAQQAGRIGIRTVVPVASAALEVAGTTGSVLLPRLNTSQTNALTPVAGMVHYNSDSGRLVAYNGSGWKGLAFTDAGGGGITTIGTISGTGNANGLSISGSTLTAHPATATTAGMVTTGAQTWAGDKTFNGLVNSQTILNQNPSLTGTKFNIHRGYANLGMSDAATWQFNIFSGWKYTWNGGADGSANMSTTGTNEWMRLSNSGLELSVPFTPPLQFPTGTGLPTGIRQYYYLKGGGIGVGKSGVGQVGEVETQWFTFNNWRYCWNGGDTLNATGTNEWMRLTSTNLAIGTTSPSASAKLDINSTTAGFLPPRLTATQRNAIATPAAGLMVYDTDSSRYMLYGSSWKGLAYTDAGGGGGGSTTSASGTGISLVNGSSLVKRLKAGFNTIVTDNTDSVTISRDTLTQTLTDGATVTFSATAGVSARVTLAGNRTLSITNMNNGMYLTLVVIQDGTGGRTLTLPAGVKVVNGGAGAVTLSSAANARDILTFFEIGDVIYCNVGRNYN